MKSSNERAPLRILFVAYPLLPVSEATCGGAEQVLSVLEREMAQRGHETVVAACEGSQAAGRLFSTGAAASGPDQYRQREAEQSARITELLTSQREPFDLVHDHSGSFWQHASSLPVPVLATLHLPRSFYPQEKLALAPPNLFFNCVSESQQRTFAGVPNMMAVAHNGIAVDRFPLSLEKEDYLLWMGRICPEKGPHIAIQVAQSVNHPLVICGEVYPFSYHKEYFDREIVPYLRESGARVYLMQKPTFEEKTELLRRARAVLIPSLVNETSSLVAMEAMACGTPPIGFRRGALPEVIAGGVTGFVVDSAEEMAEAVNRTSEIDPRACRRQAEERFTSQRMADDYERLYNVVGLYTQLQEMKRAA